MMHTYRKMICRSQIKLDPKITFIEIEQIVDCFEKNSYLIQIMAVMFIW